MPADWLALKCNPMWELACVGAGLLAKAVDQSEMN